MIAALLTAAILSWAFDVFPVHCRCKRQLFRKTRPPHTMGLMRSSVALCALLVVLKQQHVVAGSGSGGEKKKGGKDPAACGKTQPTCIFYLTDGSQLHLYYYYCIASEKTVVNDFLNAGYRQMETAPEII